MPPPAQDRPPSENVDYLNFDFGSTLPPGALNPAIPGYAPSPSQSRAAYDRASVAGRDSRLPQPTPPPQDPRYQSYQQQSQVPPTDNYSGYASHQRQVTPEQQRLPPVQSQQQQSQQQYGYPYRDQRDQGFAAASPAAAYDSPASSQVRKQLPQLPPQPELASALPPSRPGRALPTPPSAPAQSTAPSQSPSSTHFSSAQRAPSGGVETQRPAASTPTKQPSSSSHHYPTSAQGANANHQPYASSRELPPTQSLRDLNINGDRGNGFSDSPVAPRQSSLPQAPPPQKALATSSAQAAPSPYPGHTIDNHISTDLPRTPRSQQQMSASGSGPSAGGSHDPYQQSSYGGYADSDYLVPRSSEGTYGTRTATPDTIRNNSAQVDNMQQQRRYAGGAAASGSDRVNMPTPNPAPSQPVSFPTAHPSNSAIDRQSPISRGRPSNELSPSWGEQAQQPSRWVQNKLAQHQSQYYDENDGYDEYVSSEGEDDVDDEVNGIRFFNPAFLSETALQLTDRVPRATHNKGGVPYPQTFTGADMVLTIQSLLPSFTRESPYDRRFALVVARSIAAQRMWVVPVDWDLDKLLRDTADDVFTFVGDVEGFQGEVPTGVQTMATKCYSASCTGNGECYAPRCPYKTSANTFLQVANAVEDEASSSQAATSLVKNAEDWTHDLDPSLLAELTEDQRKRQVLIRQAIMAEERFEADLATIETVFLTPLQMANPPIIQPYHKLDTFLRELFSNIVQIRLASRRVIAYFGARLHEEAPLVHRVGDIFLEAATDFRRLYPEYTDNMPRADLLLTHALAEHTPFRNWAEAVSKTGSPSYDLRLLLKQPAAHLQQYPALIEGILKVTPSDDVDIDFLNEALTSIQNISYISQLKLWHASKGRGAVGKLQWHQIVPKQIQEQMQLERKKEIKRQHHIWELIEGEMKYVADLEAMDTLYITPLREAEHGPVIDRSRLDDFVDEVFHNYRSILEVHQRLLEDLQERQIEQHPNFGMVSDLLLNAALNWNAAYLEYTPHYPLAKARVDRETEENPRFKAFLDEAYKKPEADRQGINHFLYRPVARLLRYQLLLKDILQAQKAVGPEDHPDIEAIPQLLEIIDNLAKATERGVEVNEAKVALWKLKATLDGGKFGTRAVRDLDLMNPMRELIHQGKVYRQPESKAPGQSWTQLNLLLFDNYFVLVKPQTKTKRGEREGAAERSIVNRRPIPLELMSLNDFSAAAQNRSLGILKNIRGGGGNEDGATQVQSDSRLVYPFTFTFIGQGPAGQGAGQYTLWTDSDKDRQTWQEKLQHAKVLRAEVNDASKVFEMTPLSLEAFYQPAGYYAPATKGKTQPTSDEFTGRVTCSVPFLTVDGRSLVAIGCQEGVWIGVRHETASLRKVLHVRGVQQIAVLEEFGLFLVLAEKSLLAYQLEALVPTAQSPPVRATPQRLSGDRDISFFTVGQINNRTLVLYMKKKGLDSVFRILEPIHARGAEDTRQRRTPFNLLVGQRPDWFRVYKDFFIPTEAQHVYFLKAKLAVVCPKAFEIMDLTDLKGGSIPIFEPNRQREKPALAELAQKCERAKPLAMFRSTEAEFLLCYDTFGIYVDRHGEPNRDLTAIEWEGKPESVVFHPPYVLLVSPSFIEVRHIDTAKLLQIYTGSDIRCTWDGTGGQANPPQDHPTSKGWGDEVKSQEPRIHICKRIDPPHGRGQNRVEQRVFELTPTLLLNNPLLNPVPNVTDPNYFPPAPLDHRASMRSTGSHNYNGYSEGNYFPPEPSISSISTANYNANGGGQYGGYAAPSPGGGYNHGGAFAGAAGFSSVDQGAYQGGAGRPGQQPSGGGAYANDQYGGQGHPQRQASHGSNRYGGYV